jgi:restriction system protein
VAIPDYQTLMLPLLKLLADQQPHHIRELTGVLANEFDLTEEERQELLPSGRQALFANRVGWARTYMGKAGLLETVSRGTVRITPIGREVLQSRPDRIDRSFLMSFDSFREFQRPVPQPARESAPVDASPSEIGSTSDPSERLDGAYREIRAALAADLLDQVKQATPQFFERLVIDLLVAMGYGGSRDDAGLAVGKSGDGGIDGIIKEDRLGLDVVYIQAKRWEHPVGRPIVQGFAGSLDGERARKGVLITTSRFTPDAEAYVKRIEKRIVLIDGERLASYMIDFGIGVTNVNTLHIRRIDQDYFEA